MRYRLPFLVLAVVLASWAVPSIRADDYTLTATGSWFCRDGTTGDVLPLAGARVELMDSDCDGSEVCDERMGVSHVREDGSFEVSGSGGDSGNYDWSKPDVYVRVIFNDDDGVRLTDELNNDRGANTPEHDHNNVQGSVNFGNWTTGLGTGQGQGTKCATWIRARSAFQSYKQLFNNAPPAGHYDVEYWSGVLNGTPWTNTDTTHWPVHYITGNVNEHEFAHSVRHAADGDGTHFAGDAFKYRYPRYHEYCDSKHLADGETVRKAFAFNEGWAEYWEGYGGGCHPVGSLDMTVEGDVAAALTDLSSCQGVGKTGMVRVLQNHPGAIHSYAEFQRFFDQEFPGACPGVSKPPLTEAIPLRVLSQKVQIDAALKEREALRADIANLTHDLTAAQLAARSTQRPCRNPDCYVVFQALVKPHVLQGSIALKRLALSRLEDNLRDADRIPGMLSSGNFSSWYAETKNAYLRKVSEVNLAAMRNAVAAATALAERSPDATPLLQDLRTKMVRIENDLRERKPPLPQMEPSLLSDRAEQLPPR